MYMYIPTVITYMQPENVLRKTKSRAQTLLSKNLPGNRHSFKPIPNENMFFRLTKYRDK